MDIEPPLSRWISLQLQPELAHEFFDQKVLLRHAFCQNLYGCIYVQRFRGEHRESICVRWLRPSLGKLACLRQLALSRVVFFLLGLLLLLYSYYLRARIILYTLYLYMKKYKV